jgi:hypothetical protein
VIIAVQRRFNPRLGSDQTLWTPERGFLVEKKERTTTGNWKPGNGLAHGMMAWAVIKGQENRVEVRFDEPSQRFVFPSMFLQLKIERKIRQIETRMQKKLKADSVFYASEVARGDSGSRAYDAQKRIRHPVD